MAELMFYQQPIVLNRETNKDLCFTATSDYGFSKGVNSVPLTGIEFFEASRDLPVLFSKDEEGNYFPIVLLSLRGDGHEQIGAEGEWTGNYIPAFIRRYPFALTEGKDLCYDSTAAGFSEEGDRLFDDEGKNTETLDSIITFLTDFDAQHQLTREFCSELSELSMFKPFMLQVMTVDKSALRLDGLFIIDEDKLGDLDNEKVGAWFRKGFLAWIYAHMHSLGSLNRLSDKL
ncbi:peptidase [Halieaceae bacterium IMCC14734]|uniref:Peptidase n=1 Tax=Candidatus Litorirhabdus singularis TaxID=2518993 RepID=A0ABT3THJ1_9GAMM|nr:SapC family protein [Candidatus Litorirhabdus singularis]MCX2981768.1 peptidase [Candidatus Litorirhabdus singularis]